MADTDIYAIIRASNYVQHGTTDFGGSFITCICPKQACGGVSSEEERDDCPEHSRTPVQRWHWAAVCPAT